MNKMNGNGFDGNNGSSSAPNGNKADSRDEPDRGSSPPSSPRPVYDPTSQYYDMSGKKLLFIFNHMTFQNTYHFEKQPSTRYGTECDVKRLQQTFGKLKFIVDAPCNDYTHNEIVDKLKEICEMDHRSTSCVAVAILTHCHRNGVVYASDKPYQLSDVFNFLSRAPSLAGKPKLFFIQACRGGNVDPGLQVHIDGHQNQTITIPTHSDCLMLILIITYKDHVSFRTANGTWMIQALCDVMDEHHKNLDIVHMMMLVNQNIAANVARSKEYPEYNNLKQTSEVHFTLNKFLKF